MQQQFNRRLLRHKMEEDGLTYRQLAEIMDVEHGTIWYVVNRGINPSGRFMLGLRRAWPTVKVEDWYIDVPASKEVR